MYSDICLDDIKIDSKPYKKNVKIDQDIKSVYYVDIVYNKYIQIPKCRLLDVCLEDNCISLCIDKSFYISFIDPLEDHIKDMVYKNSSSLFYKSFSVEKISRCFVSNVEFIDSMIILKLNISNFVSIYNRNKERINFNDINCKHSDSGIEVVSIISIENLQFIDNLFTCNIKVEQLKIYNDVKLVEYSILESKSDTNSILSNEQTKSYKKYICSSSTDSVVLEDEYFRE